MEEHKYDESNIVGRRFGRLLVIRQSDTKKAPSIQKYVCLCDCGRAKDIAATSLVRGASKSCGCLHRDVVSKHGHSAGGTGSPTYQSWVAMVARCTSPTSGGYSYYGGRGVTVCDRWLESFENFLEDMGERPDGKTLDRIDDALVYSKATCRWATRKEQQRNRRNTLFVEIDGETITMKEAAEKFGIHYGTAMSRRRRGLSPAEIFKKA